VRLDPSFGGGVVEPFNLETERIGETLRVRLTGRFDLMHVGGVDELLRGTQRDIEHDSIVVDLRGVTSMDSSALQALVSAALRAKEHGGRFRLNRGPDKVHRIFELTGLDKTLDFVEGDAMDPEGSDRKRTGLGGGDSESDKL
jgi:anti-anti-sigma factor